MQLFSHQRRLKPKDHMQLLGVTPSWSDLWVRCIAVSPLLPREGEKMLTSLLLMSAPANQNVATQPVLGNEIVHGCGTVSTMQLTCLHSRKKFDWLCIGMMKACQKHPLPSVTTMKLCEWVVQAHQMGQINIGIRNKGIPIFFKCYYDWFCIWPKLEYLKCILHY